MPAARCLISHVTEVYVQDRGMHDPTIEDIVRNRVAFLSARYLGCSASDPAIGRTVWMLRDCDAWSPPLGAGETPHAWTVLATPLARLGPNQLETNPEYLSVCDALVAEGLLPPQWSPYAGGLYWSSRDPEDRFEHVYYNFLEDLTDPRSFAEWLHEGYTANDARDDEAIRRLDLSTTDIARLACEYFDPPEDDYSDRSDRSVRHEYVGFVDRDRPERFFRGAPDDLITRHVGCEIEVSQFVVERGDTAKLRTLATRLRELGCASGEDGSLRGPLSLEVRTPPIAGTVAVDTLRAVCAAASEAGGQILECAGGHIHVDARDFSRTGRDGRSLESVVKVWPLFASYFEELAEREPTNYCRRWPLFTRGESYRDRVDTIANDRYMQLNLAAFDKYGTLEFRLFAGSLDPEAWIKRAKAACAFVDFAHGVESRRSRESYREDVESLIAKLRGML